MEARSKGTNTDRKIEVHRSTGRGENGGMCGRAETMRTRVKANESEIQFIASGDHQVPSGQRTRPWMAPAPVGHCG